MKTVNIHEAKTHLSRLIIEAANGSPFIIARAGKPVVKVIAFEAPDQEKVRRLGFMSGLIVVPEDFNQIGEEEIHNLFGDHQ